MQSAPANDREGTPYGRACWAAACLSLMIPLAILAVACSGQTVAKDPDPDGPTSHGTDDLAPFPYTVDELRSANQPGRWRVYETRSVDTPDAAHLLFAFDDTNTDDATFTSAMIDPEAHRIRMEKTTTARWTDLQRHASYPADATTFEETEVTLPVGTFQTTRYTVTRDTEEGRQITRAWFAADPELAGAPLRLVVELDGAVQSEMELLAIGDSWSGRGITVRVPEGWEAWKEANPAWDGAWRVLVSPDDPATPVSMIDIRRVDPAALPAVEYGTPTDSFAKMLHEDRVQALEADGMTIVTATLEPGTDKDTEPDERADAHFYSDIHYRWDESGATFENWERTVVLSTSRVFDIDLMSRADEWEAVAPLARLVVATLQLDDDALSP